MTKVYVDGKAIVLKPANVVGAGGEAEVFDVGGGRALKLFKPADHPDFAVEPGQQAAAVERLAERQDKLRRFPTGLPARVVQPEKLATTRDGRRVLGYTMKLLAGAEALSRYGDRSFRQVGVPSERVLAIFPLLDHLHHVFVRDRRGTFPLPLLEALRFTRCQACGTEHARPRCPACLSAGEAAVREVTTVRGQVCSTRVFRTRGNILCASLDGGALHVLVHEDGALKREDGFVVLEGDPLPGMRFGLAGRRTFVARAGLLLTLSPDAPPERRSVEGAGAAFAVSGGRLFWVEAGGLRREGAQGAERIGDVLSGRTAFWVGREFGFGCYRAGDLQVAFVFAAEGRGINDRVAWPRLPGHLLDMRCLFGQGRCWFLTASQDGGRRTHRCLVVRSDGSVEAAAEGEPGDGSWLAGLDGKCAAGGFLLAATDEGLVRLEVDHGRIVKTKEFPDAEPFVDPAATLLPGGDGLYAVDPQEVRRLRIA